jgi:hypothetical protein
MSGKANAGTKVENRGGYRPGSGRKPDKPSSYEDITRMKRAAKKRAKLEGKTLDDIVLDIAYANVNGIGCKVEVRDRLLAVRLYKEFSQPKISEQNVNVKKTEGPTVYLPALDKENAKVIEGGKAESNGK